jgi:DNA-binding transcriptional LysR family regulator
MVRFLPPLLARLADAAPRLRLRAVPLGSWQIESELESGEADLALGAFPRAASHLRRQKLYADGYVGAVRKDHRRLREMHSLAGFCAGRHILITASEIGHAAHSQAERTISAKIAPSNVLLRVPSFLAGAIVASQTDGIATLPENLAARVARRLAWSRSSPRCSCRASRSPNTGTNASTVTRGIAGCARRRSNSLAKTGASDTITPAG